MPATTRIDLHLHSTYSDGRLSPAAVAERVARRGVALAALADHDTLASQAPFRAALARRGIASVSAVELTTWDGDQELHLLAYGVDTEHRELLATVAALGQLRSVGIHSVSGALQHRAPEGAGALPLEQGRLRTAEAIALVHRAGGKAFLAHPLLNGGLGAAEATVARLASAGLDGLEALYARYSAEEQGELVALAARHGLLVSAGSDFHDEGSGPPPGVDVPEPHWRTLQSALAGTLHGAEPGVPRLRRHSLRRFALRVVLPSALAIVLFVGTIFAFILPRFEAALLDRKREMIRELTNSAITILEDAHRAERTGLLTRAEAQAQAASRISTLRYGPEAKDYFWIQDLSPRMVMHPYRPELNGQDVAEFRDARGVRIFVEFADVVRRREQGYVDYVWQWNDDPARLAPKESYVRGFSAWGWLIGTGLYTEDVRHEIEELERGLIWGSTGIVGLVMLLLLYVVRESLQLERQRRDAELHLLETTQRYQSLVEASSEGALVLVDGRCRYANPTLLKILGHTASQAQLLHLDDFLPSVPLNAAARGTIERGEASVGDALEAELRDASGAAVRIRLTVMPVRIGDQQALILQARPDSRRSPVEAVVLPGFPSLIARLEGASEVRQVSSLCHSLVSVVGPSLEFGARARHVTRQLSEVCDAATGQLIRQALAELPPPPCAFCFVGMGSHGRQEQTLLTDQDNAIIFADDVDVDAARAWFAQLGQKVCTHLDAAGYAFCRGDVMAQNPRWCNPVSVWKRLFRQWIAKSEPQELLELAVFFDLRPVFGEEELVSDLRADTAAALAGAPHFFPHFAHNALDFKPPLRLFGRILSGAATGEGGARLDLKDAQMPIVSFARLYALKHDIRATNTFDRIDALSRRGVLASSTQADLSFVHEHLLRLRLEHQLALLRDGRPVDNVISHAALSHIQAVLLREVFGQVDVIQQRVRLDFLGG
jgi:predicted metal-dependent phosphoesterase TrpH